jgi:biotin/methionine sulfoxide reductase
MDDSDTVYRPHSSHWGAFSAALRDGEVLVRPHPRDPDPSPLLRNFTDGLRHRARIATPMVRENWLRHGPGPDTTRGRGRFVPMSWDAVLDRLAGELARIGDRHGPEAIFGGSYGWSSAGRFHHAQGQIHRFLNTVCGGYVRSVGSYSAGASSALLPHILGPFEAVTRRNVTWEQIAAHTDLVVAFGGLPLRNMAVGQGGVSRHIERDAMARAAARGCRFVNVSPVRADLPHEAVGEWLPIVPGTDVALMLALTHTLLADGRHDREFLERCCTGWDRFASYLLGETDGVVKDAVWAAALTGIEAAAIQRLARRMADGRTLVVVAHALQRAEHGEQPVWAGAALAAALGQIGLPGGGYNYALGTIAHYGRRRVAVPLPTLPQGRNAVEAFIPCARIADMLLEPGGAFDFNGQSLRYPDIKLVYWAGGNPFHHHQDLNRLRRAFQRVETIVVHDSAWTATARHADVVLPCTTTLERDDIGGGGYDPLLVAMHQVAPPFAEARDDYAIFAGLAERLGAGPAFTEGRDVQGWLRHLYEPTRRALEEAGHPAPDFDAFWEAGELELPQDPDDGGILRAFREDPAGAPLPTPTGRIEIASAVIESFGYADCPGHPAWLSPSDKPSGTAPLWLLASQPATRLHSQLDFAAHSQAAKHRGREVATLHPADAAARGIGEGDIVKLWNARGACLAAARISDGIREGVVQLPTGAWYDPDDPAAEQPLCVHGNPNVLTRDAGTSRLGQGCTGQLTAVQVERFGGNLPPIRAYDSPLG